MTKEQLLLDLARELRPYGEEQITGQALAEILERLAQSVGYREWEERMGDDL